jgi:hypothetical protein
MFKQFTIKIASNNVAHLIFDMPDRSMNVFSNSAIAELGEFAAWLKTSDVRLWYKFLNWLVYRYVQINFGSGAS